MVRSLFAFCVALACACSGSSDNAEPSAHHGKLELVEKNLDECVLCRLCLDAVPDGVRVLKLYENGAAL